MEFAETVETIAAEEASVRNLFAGDGQRVRESAKKKADYKRKLLEASRFMSDIYSGRRPMHHMQEALSTSDFPILLGDILDRQLLANYQEYPADYLSYVRKSTVPTFNSVKRYAVDGLEGQLDEVDELSEYPEGTVSESADELSVRKYGKRIDLSWETLVNDDLDAFRNLPQRLARGARRTEAKFVTSLFVDSTGPHASLYDASNTVTGNPALSVASLATALQMMSTLTDEDDEPIFYEALELVVPPALEVTANNIVNAISIEMTDQGGSASQKLIAKNWLQNRLNVVVNPYIPVIANSANGNTSWFLFGSQADNSGARPALEFAHLRGHEEPALYEKAPDSRRVGGGGEAMESFDTDSRAWKVRHVMGGARLVNTGGKKSTVASEGDGN